jgi:hypothetical protein
MRTNTGVSTATHTAPATTHTYNATWTQLVASTAFDAVGFMLRLNTATAVSGARSDYIVQLGIGTAGSEQVVMTAPIGFRAIGTQISLPLFIPAGSRIAVRHKGFVTVKALAYTFDYYGSQNRDMSGLPQKWVAYGLTDTASQSSGTAVTSGNTNAWGSWTALTTSTTYAHQLWVPMIDAGTAAAATALNYRSQFAIASTTDAATMVTNATVWEGPIWTTTTAELMNSALTVTAGSWVIGGQFSPLGIIYDPKPDASAVSMRAMCSGTAEATCFGSILAAVM